MIALTVDRIGPVRAAYYELRDALIAAGGRLPYEACRLALAGDYAGAGQVIRATSNADAITRPSTGRFADEVPALTGEATVELRGRVLANIADVLAGAGPLELDHFAYMAEAPCRSDVGRRIGDLVEDEHTRQLLSLALVASPPAGDFPRAGGAR